MLSGYELYTDIGLDTFVALQRDLAHDVREQVFSERHILSFCLALSGVLFIFFVMGMFLWMTCGRC